MKRHGIAVVLSAVMVLLVLPTIGYGQAPTNEELLQTIKKLEARLAELEAKSGRSPAPAAAGAPEPQLSAIQQEVETLKKKDSESAPILNFFKSTQLSGYVDGYYAVNLNDPADQSIGARGVTTNHNSFQFNAAKLSFNRALTGPGSLGYRLDLVYGPLADSFNVSFEPANAGFSVQRNILNGYVSYSVPVGKGLNLDFGKFTTFIGAEVFDTIDNWNYQQGIMFSFAQPYYHTGLRASYAPSDKVGLGFYLVNGWNNSFDNNTGKSVGFSLTLTPSSKFQLIQNYLGGPENTAPIPGGDISTMASLTATINQNVALKFNYDIGANRPLISSDPRQDWRGIASSVRFSRADGKIALAPRFEYLYDNSGFATGARQDLKTLTLTNEYRIKPNFSTKLEYRYDFSNQNIFKKEADQLVKDQHVFLLGLVYSFGFGKE